jgi:hypothetical protein
MLKGAAGYFPSNEKRPGEPERFGGLQVAEA